ncbi:MAG: hypothetical protein NT031_14130 [Planctomycetota bacterium]|nr:hypothetical protein [Planctomycetota bacterium]
MLILRRGSPRRRAVPSGLPYRHALASPGQQERIGSPSGGIRAQGRVPLPRRQGHRAFDDIRRHPRGCFHRHARIVSQFDHIAIRHSHRLGLPGIDIDPTPPGHARHGVWRLLQPRPIGDPAVEEHHGGIDADVSLPWIGRRDQRQIPGHQGLQFRVGPIPPKIIAPVFVPTGSQHFRPTIFERSRAMICRTDIASSLKPSLEANALQGKEFGRDIQWLARGFRQGQEDVTGVSRVV